MIVCGACGAQWPDTLRFCGACGASLRAAAAPVQERKVVTTLFCDLVGFTAMSEAADPEDVDAALGRYFAVARAAIEAYGGTVEKFIGDAVVGVFGVPAAHEDDPERAVRAGLRITEDVEALTRPDGSPLQLRVGVNTGEAFVRLDVTAASGEGFLTGDAVNTAARIQSVAPLMGVAVGVSTYQATRPVFDYQQLEPATLKGKTDPVDVWHAVAPLARFGTDITRRHDSPMVGREADLAVLRQMLDRTIATATPHMVTIVGEPGLGKSRLLAETLAHVDDLPYPVTWRQGRCLPYGDGITFWALGEIIKGHAGILDTDTSDAAVTKLDAVLPNTEDREWLRQRLLPLLGIEASASPQQGELFAAWQRFIESIATDGPTVLVFEDLHWADPALLDFLQHLAEHTTPVPLLVLATARPDLFDDHPDFGTEVSNAATIRLTPLDEADTERLVSALLQTIALPEDLQEPLVQRVGGNPLFAEEFVRLLQDRGVLERVDDVVQLRPGVDLPLPDTVQSVIAARLDALAPSDKAVLAEAAVIGQVFWAGAVATMTGQSDLEAHSSLQHLARKSLIRPARHSAMFGEAEYVFWHVLIRDVAYAQLPRSARATKHLAAAEWIQDHAGDRVEDQADVLAYHYGTALGLLQASGDDALARELQAVTGRFLLLAGERAMGMDAASGRSQLEQALTLIPDDDPLRGRALAAYGKASFHTLHFENARETLEEAVALLRDAGDVGAAVDALFELAKFLRRRGDPEWFTPYQPMLDLIAERPPGPEHVRAYTYHAAYNTLRGWTESGIDPDLQQLSVDYADRAIALATELGVPIPAEAVGWRGNARVAMGDLDGIDDIREAIRLGTPTGQRSVGIMYQNLAVTCLNHVGHAQARQVLDDGIAYADRHGLSEIALMLRNILLWPLLNLGEIDELLALAERQATDLQAAGDGHHLSMVRDLQIRASLLRGEVEGARDWVDFLAKASQDCNFGRDDVAGLGVAATAYAALGRRDAARSIFSTLSDRPDVDAIGSDPDWTRTLIALGELELATKLVSSEPDANPASQYAHLACVAAVAEARGDYTVALAGYVDAAQRFGAFTIRTEEAFALLGQGRCLVALGRPDEAGPMLLRARDMFTKMGARPALAEVDALLASTSSSIEV